LAKVAKSQTKQLTFSEKNQTKQMRFSEKNQTKPKTKFFCGSFAFQDGGQQNNANLTMRPPLLFHHLLYHLSRFGGYFQEVDACRQMRNVANHPVSLRLTPLQ
jgi:hypothetical protein